MELKDVVGYEGLYLVSSCGLIFSIPRRSSPGKFLKPYHAKHGYSKVNLSKNGEINQFYVHDIVASAFIGKKPNGFQVRHLNGNGYDNNVKNLKYGTQSDNELDKVALGLSNRGSRHGKSKLKECDILQIRSDTNKTQFQLAKIFGVHQVTISKIKKNKLWSHLNAS